MERDPVITASALTFPDFIAPGVAITIFGACAAA